MRTRSIQENKQILNVQAQFVSFFQTRVDLFFKQTQTCSRATQLTYSLHI
jgi:hypothetical protein